MKTIKTVQQIINDDKTYSYFLNGKCIKSKTFRNWNFYILEMDSFCFNIKSAIYNYKYWTKNNDIEKYTFLTIQK